MKDPQPPDIAAPDLQVQDVLAGISEGFVTVDDRWRFTYVNPAAERMWSLHAADVLGRTAAEALGIEPDNPFQACYQESKSNGEPVAFSAFSALYGGWLEVRGVPRHDGYAMFFRDVTEARRSHLASLERERDLRTANTISQRVFDTSQDLILVTDSGGNLIRVSPSALTILGYEPAEMEGHSALDFIFRGDLDATREQMRLARRGGAVSAFDCRYVHKDGRVVSLSWKGVWSPAAAQHFFMGRDMTERIAAEERLRHTQRLEAVGQLTGGIAHDFNNLLSVVLGNADLLLARDDVGAEAKQYAAAVLHAAQRGAELTRGLLAFARQQSLNPTVIEPNALIGNWMRVLGRAVGEQVDVEFLPGPDIWPVRVDAANLETVIANLAVNARDAMPDGGRLLIETYNATLDDDYVKLNPEARPGDYVAIVVTDTGTGMPPEVLEHVFEPFFTTKPTGQGTGLGLSSVFGFVKQSDGHIKAYSEVGHGTSIRLYLPRADASEPSVAADDGAPGRPSAARQGRILVVEDNEAIRQLVLQQLDMLGYDTLEAADAAAALAILEDGADVDLLFTDVVMPGGMNGRMLASAAVARQPGLKVLLTSGFPGAAAGDEADGRFRVLPKPYRQQTLDQAIHELLNE